MPKPHAFFLPNDWTEARQLLSQPGLAAIPWLVGPRPSAPASLNAGVLVDLSRLGLDYVRESSCEVLCIGSLTTLQSIVDSPLVAAYTRGMLSRAACLAAPLKIRNLASLWGTLQSRQGPPEVVLALLALDAQVVVQDVQGVAWTYPFSDFFAQGETALAPGDIVQEVCFSGLTAAGSGWGLERVSRAPRDESIVAAAAVLAPAAGGTCFCRLAISGAAPFPVRFPAAEALLTFYPLTDGAIRSAAAAVMAHGLPPSDFRAGAEYRCAMSAVVARRALESARKTGGILQ